MSETEELRSNQMVVLKILDSTRDRLARLKYSSKYSGKKRSFDALINWMIDLLVTRKILSEN